jgi:hypothetical protein
MTTHINAALDRNDSSRLVALMCALMKLRTGLVLLSVATIGCTPYERTTGEYNAGPVDPASFPAPYLGAKGSPKRGGGSFNASIAFVDGTMVGYYPFPFTAAQGMADDPLAVTENGAPDSFNTPTTYVFDPAAGNPFPAKPGCTPPPGYTYNEKRDGIHYDDQGNVFMALPTDATYVPVVAEVPVTSMGEACQSIKTVKTLVQDKQISVPLMQPPKNSPPDALATGIADGKLLAWAIIDPSAMVYFPDGSLDMTTKLGPQKYGWYEHYLVVYLDGGYIPTMNNTLPSMMNTPPVMVTDMVPQMLFVPTQVPGKDTMGNPAAVPTMGQPGSGFDVLQAQRGSTGYSPVCQVVTFVPQDPMNPPTKASAIDMTTVMPAPTPFIFCLQLE